MKYSQMISLLMIIVFFQGCSKTENGNANLITNNESNVSSTSVQKISSEDSANFSKSFEGVLDNKYPIVMKLQRNGNNLSGSYLYTKYGVSILIKGDVDGQDNFIINEFDSKGNQTGIFKGRLLSSNEMEGNWSKPNGDKSMPFLLKAKENSNETVSTTIASPTPIAQSSQTPQRTDELTRETVLSLIRSRLTKEVKASMNTSSNAGLGNLTQFYDTMIKAKVIACPLYNSDNCLCYSKCRPSTNSQGLFLDSSESGMVTGAMAVVIGRKVPTSVTGISKSNPTTAIADVVLTFEQTGGYKLFEKYSSVFWKRNYTQTEQRRVILRLYDDGWRLEQILN